MEHVCEVIQLGKDDVVALQDYQISLHKSSIGDDRRATTIAEDVTGVPYGSPALSVVCSCGWEANAPLPDEVVAEDARRYHLATMKNPNHVDVTDG
jgi:hypothetical protein